MQIVAVQLEIAWQDKAANRTRVERLLADADVQSGSLIVLPEMFETGFSMNLEITAQSETRESEVFLQELASKYRSTVLGGVVGPVINGKASNEAVAFSPDGELLVRYQKRQPFSRVSEGEHYAPGNRSALFGWNGIKVAPFICYDLRFPEIFRPSAVIDGAELFLGIACWPAVRSEHWVRLIQARAIENLAIAIGVNRCGQEPNLDFDGRSCGFDHLGKPLFEANSDEQVIKTEIDVESLRVWRSKFPALADASL